MVPVYCTWSVLGDLGDTSTSPGPATQGPPPVRAVAVPFSTEDSFLRPPPGLTQATQNSPRGVSFHSYSMRTIGPFTMDRHIQMCTGTNSRNKHWDTHPLGLYNQSLHETKPLLKACLEGSRTQKVGSSWVHLPKAHWGLGTARRSNGSGFTAEVRKQVCSMTTKPSPPQAVQRIMPESLTLLEWAYCGLTATVTSFTTLYCNHQPAAAEPALLPVCYTGNPERASNSSGSQGAERATLSRPEVLAYILTITSSLLIPP